MKFLAAFLLVITVSATTLSSQELLAGGILSGSNWACLVKAPTGWSMDQTSLAKSGIYGLFCENG